MSTFTSRTSRMPSRSYKRRHAVSSHAMERFRERVDEEFRHRDDEDLANLLDDRICHAEHSYEVRDPRAPEEITTLFTVECRSATYYAVVRDQTVVTVLDEAMAQNNFAGQWSPVMNAPFAVLRGLKIPPPAPTPPPTPAPVASPTPIDEAGIAYARARKRQRACEDTIAALRTELDRATEALREATLAVDETHQRLMDLAEGKKS